MQSPWVHTVLAISPTEFEKEVANWIRLIGEDLESLEVLHNQKLHSHDGSYQIDVVATFNALGVKFKVLIECKRHSSPIPRSYVELLNSRLQSLGAQKGILVATTGFQSGAIQFATKHGIALVKIVEGKTMYETRSLNHNPDPPPWANFPKYFGQLIQESKEGNTSVTLVDFRETSFLGIVQNAH